MTGTDPTAINGRQFALEAHWPIVVIGGGASGAKAATDAARQGKRVLLVDEHPVPPGLLGLDVPYLFSGRLDASVQNSARVLETVFAARPALSAAAEAGVELALGISVWGAFARGPASRNLKTPLLGLADEKRAWLVGAEQIIVAAGTRDLALPFPGCTLPGVMGACGFLAAVALYRAFSGRRIAVLGKGDAANAVLAAAAEAGIAVALHAAEPAPVRALGKLGVEAIVHGGSEHACDTIVLAVDRVPNVELFDVLGTPIEVDGARGGFVPGALPAYLTGVGACLGRAEPVDRMARRQAWLAAIATEDAPLCRCEQVQVADLLDLRPPKYLADDRHKSLKSLGPLDQDQVKRLTRAGMGPCQGRRCRDAIHALLARDAESMPPMASFRPPLRPLPLAALAALPETQEVHDNWTAWFGIATQWLPHWQPAEENAAYLGLRLATPGQPTGPVTGGK